MTLMKIINGLLDWFRLRRVPHPAVELRCEPDSGESISFADFMKGMTLLPGARARVALPPELNQQLIEFRSQGKQVTMNQQPVRRIAGTSGRFASDLVIKVDGEIYGVITLELGKKYQGMRIEMETETENKFWRGGKRTPEYRAALLHQLEQWIAGVWEHNSLSDECTPDFGCCVPSMRDSADTRRVVGQQKLLELRDS